MAYQVLARKWRPQDFESVVGQAPVVTALQNALADGRVAQAYLFSGIRGVGKTSVARVFAKALNCKNDPPSDPCNDCTSCSEIAAGADLDVLEIDAATYSKVEQVRELTDSLRYGPARDRYKVVIIDEIHRLSRQAFDALLKIVEEPPEHLVFMFATTEIEAVPATILSRCQSFQLRRVPLVELVEHLGRISEAEGLGASDHALRLIARAGEGSVRDAVALLDQIATFGGGTVSDDEVGRILGGADLAVHHGLLQAILAGERNNVSATVRRIEAEGWDPRHVYGDFLAYCRDALHLVLDPEAAPVALPAEEAAALARDAGGAGYENMLRLLHLLLDSEMSVRRSESASLALEIALLRAAELPKLVAIEELLGGGPVAEDAGGGAPPAGGGQSAGDGTPGRKAAGAKPGEPVAAPHEPAIEPGEAAPKSQPEAKRVEKPGPDEAVRSASRREAAPEPQPVLGEEAGSEQEAQGADSPEAAPAGAAEAEPSPPQTAPAEPDEDPRDTTPPEPPPGSSAAVARLLEQVSYVKQPLAAHLSHAESLVLEDGRLTIAAKPGDAVLERTLKRKSNRTVLDKTMTEMMGPQASWRIVAGTGRETGPVTTGELAEETDDVTSDPTVQTVLDLFGGQIESVETRGDAADR